MPGIIWCAHKTCLLSHRKGRDSAMINRAQCCTEHGINAEKLCTWHSQLKSCTATAALCCCLMSMCYWFFSIHILMEIWSTQCKPGHTPRSSFKRHRKLEYIAGKRSTHWSCVFSEHYWWGCRSCEHAAERLWQLASVMTGQTSLVDAVPDRYRNGFGRCHIHHGRLSCCEEILQQ